MKTRPFNRKSIALLFAIVVFFCSIQSLSFAQVELVAEPLLTRLTESTLHNSTVVLDLGGTQFEDNVQRYLSVSGISGVSIDNVKLLDNTVIRVRLKFSGDFDQDDTLTFTVRSGGIKNYNGRNLTDEVPVTANVESVTATTLAPLTEATLDNSTVTLTLRGRTFEENIRKSYDLTVSGISGVDIDDVKLLSGTEIRMRLEFSGDFDQNDTLTFTVRSSGIKNYNGSNLTDEIPVTANVEPRLAFKIRNPTRVTTYYQVQWSNNDSWQNYSLDSGFIRTHWSHRNIPAGYPKVRFDYIAGDQQTTHRFYSLETAEYREETDDVPTYHFKYNQQGNELDLFRTTQTIPVVSTPQPTVVHIPDPNLRAAIQQEIGNTLTTNTMLNLTFLEADELGITNLTGLEHATNLIYLYLSGNNISDVSPLAGLTRLTDLDLWGNNISDISALIGLTQLTDLDLEENPLNAAALTTHIPTIQARGTDVYFDNRVPTTPQSLANVVHIPDPNLRAAIQQEIGNTLTTNTMLNLTSLEAYERGITNLTGLEHATNLSELYLPDNSISDVSPLAGLTQLTALNFWDNSNISDVSPLAGLTQLTYLYLGGNSISDVSPLAGLTQLTYLYLEDNNISDISALTGLTQLTDLDLEENPLNNAALTTDIPAIQANGTWVEFDDHTPTTPPPPSVDGPRVAIPPNVVTTGSHPSVYWSDGTTIRRASLDSSNVTDLVTGVNDPKGIALDIAGGKIYWTEDIYWIESEEPDPWGEKSWPVGKIRCADLNGSNVTDLVTGVDDPKGIALDIAGGKMYWTSQRGLDRATNTFTGKIQCADLDGSNVTDLVTGVAPLRYGIALDVAGGKMYWPTWTNIQCADLDGSNVRTLVTGVANLTDIALDVAGGKMYWVDLGKIQCADLDGSNVQDILPVRGKASDIALDVAGGKIYWTGLGKIRYANLDGSNVDGSNARDLVTGGTYHPTRIALGIPPQTVVSRPAKTTQIHVDAADRPSMYWIDTAAGTLHRLVDAEVENLVPSVQNATSLTLDVANNKFYWTEKTSNTTGKIRRANLDGTNVQLVLDLTSVPFDITLDAANGKLYLTNSWGKVQRLNLDGSGFQSNLITGLDMLTGIAIDVAGGKLYWTEKTSNTTGKIRRANLDGTNVQLLRDLTSAPFDIALDAADGKLYLTNSWGNVQRLNLDGSGFQSNFITGLDTPMDIAVDTVGQKLYLTSPDGKISQRNLSGGGSQEVVTGLGGLGALALGGTTTVPPTTATSASKATYDVNGDGTVNDKDARLLTDAISNGSTDDKYDVNGDGKVNFDDLQLVLDNRDRNPYDVNGGGTVDDKDARLLTDAISNGSTDDKYDVNDDGKVNFDDLQLVLDNRDSGAAGAPLITKNMKLAPAQIARIQEQIELLIATSDRSPAAMRTLIYLQQFLAMARPEKTQLLANYPNPFNPETWLPYQLSTDSDVRITIYDTSGRVVRRLMLGYQSAGYYTSRSRAAYWDGGNAVGEPVASGIYFYTLTAGDFTATRKLLIRK